MLAQPYFALPLSTTNERRRRSLAVASVPARASLCHTAARKPCICPPCPRCAAARTSPQLRTFQTCGLPCCPSSSTQQRGARPIYLISAHPIHQQPPTYPPPCFSTGRTSCDFVFFSELVHSHRGILSTTSRPPAWNMRELPRGRRESRTSGKLQVGQQRQWEGRERCSSRPCVFEPFWYKKTCC